MLVNAEFITISVGLDGHPGNRLALNTTWLTGQATKDQEADRLQCTPCGVHFKRVRLRIRLVFFPVQQASTCLPTEMASSYFLPARLECSEPLEVQVAEEAQHSVLPVSDCHGPRDGCKSRTDQVGHVGEGLLPCGQPFWVQLAKLEGGEEQFLYARREMRR